MIVTAYEHGLDNVTEEAVSAVVYAVENHLKDILTSVVSRRKAYRLRDGHFKYAFGSNVTPQPYLKNSVVAYNNLIESEVVEFGCCMRFKVSAPHFPKYSGVVPWGNLVSQLRSLEPLCLHSTVGSQDLSDVLSHPSEMTWITFIPVLSLFREKRAFSAPCAGQNPASHLPPDDAEQQAALLLACSGDTLPTSLPPVNMYDLFEALQVTLASLRFT
ncbi:Transcriptional adapter 1, partial [Eschrichtius robustus]|nr:Transcriptional adapter 1 [Eschrichtius robustus]